MNMNMNMQTMAQDSRPRPAPSRWARVRGFGAIAAVCVFLGTAALAPYSMTDAFALTADEPGAGHDASWSASGERGTQGLGARDASELFIDTSVTAAAPAAAAAEATPGSSSPIAALYSIEEFMFTGSVSWSGYRFTFYSQQVLPGPGLAIPGRHVNEGGYVSDEDGFIVLAGSHPKGTVFDTPFGYQGKIYDRGTVGNHLDVYIR